MAKKESLDRRKAVDQIRKKQRNDERRRNVKMYGAVGVVVALIIGAALVPVFQDWWTKREYDGRSFASIGAPASACQPIETKSATGNQDHVEPGTPLTYDQAPPAFGRHYNVWKSIGQKFYTAEDRPDLGYLVHNQEHGYTMLWYDDTAAADDDMMDEIKGLATKFDNNDSDYRNKFKAVPWTAADSKANGGVKFPKGQHIAMTHWSVGGPGNAGDESKQVGVWQYCSSPSGAALQSFMQKYPYTDTPEPAAI